MKAVSYEPVPLADPMDWRVKQIDAGLFIVAKELTNNAYCWRKVKTENLEAEGVNPDLMDHYRSVEKECEFVP